MASFALDDEQVRSVARLYRVYVAYLLLKPFALLAGMIEWLAAIQDKIRLDCVKVLVL